MAITNNFLTSPSGKKVNVTGITGKPLQRITRMTGNDKIMRARNVSLRNRLNNAQTAAPAAPAAPAPAAPAQQTAAPGTADTLFPGTRMFEPKNYEGSPLYQFQVQQGQKQLGKSLAARGLTNSGYGIEQELNIPMRAAAQDTERMTFVAKDNADRLQTMQQNEANRLERQGNNQWDRLYNTASLLSAQSPWQAAVGGLDSSANLAEASGVEQTNFLKDFYQRQFAAQQYPGAVPAFQGAPPAATPSVMGKDNFNAMNGASQYQDWATFFANLFKPQATAAETPK